MNIVPTRFFHLSLVFLVALNLVPHFNDYTVPTLAVGGVCLIWRLLYEYQIVPLPNFFTKIGFILSICYLVYLNYGRLWGLEAGSALLICAVSLKLIDCVGYRDAMVLLFTNFMLLLVRFFESQTLGITVFAAFDLIITTALLVQLHNGSKFKFDILTLLKTGSKLVLQISPFMILLFFIFPRFSTSFLSIQSNKPSVGGFSETMEPGAIESLAISDYVAFRVNFFGEPPEVDQMYWRGGILDVNHGMRWERGRFKKTRLKTPPIKLMRQALKQEIMMEPLFNKWLFGLDQTYWVEQKNKRLQKMTRKGNASFFILNKTYDKKFVYEAFSGRPQKEALSSKERLRYLQFEETEDQRVLDLVTKLKSKTKGNEAKAHSLMNFYRTKFRYTLSPGKLQSHKIGEFLFEKKVGFCEHFAVSFASLMRMAGVPARVVVGFHGGVKNKLSDYFIVSSRDAHAWTEVWSERKKIWLRFDPTSVVSPLRIELGGQIYHSLNGQQVGTQGVGDLVSRYNSSWLNQSFLALDALATNWNRFLLNYDQEGQRGFFAQIGFDSVNQNALLLSSLLILLIYFLWIRLKNNSEVIKESSSQRAYKSLQKKILTAGIHKESFEGPRDFIGRCAGEFPENEVELRQFLKAYLKSEYGDEKVNLDLNAFVKSIDLKVKPQSK